MTTTPDGPEFLRRLAAILALMERAWQRWDASNALPDGHPDQARLRAEGDAFKRRRIAAYADLTHWCRARGWTGPAQALEESTRDG